jgi:hypothetical protein
MKLLRLATFALLAGMAASHLRADVYLEDFEAGFPAWESGWLGTNSDLANYYGVGAGRGNNPDGLWPAGSGSINVNFLPSFGADITQLALDVASFVDTPLMAYDSSGNLIFNASVSPNFGAYTDPGVYQHFIIDSANGISRFSFTGENSPGNLSIDNVQVTTSTDTSRVPDSGSTAVLMLVGGAVLLPLARRRLA